MAMFSRVPPRKDNFPLPNRQAAEAKNKVNAGLQHAKPAFDPMSGPQLGDLLYYFPQDKVVQQAVQMSVARRKATVESPRHIHAVATQGVQGAGQPLPYREKLQAAFGQHDLSQIQAFTGTSAAKANQALDAKAYAMGNKIAFRDQHPDLHTVAHETTHVIQQRAGVHLKSGVGESGDRYENQADQVADSIVQNKSAGHLLNSNQRSPSFITLEREVLPNNSNPSAVQMLPIKPDGEKAKGNKDEIWFDTEKVSTDELKILLQEVLISKPDGANSILRKLHSTLFINSPYLSIAEQNLIETVEEAMNYKDTNSNSGPVKRPLDPSEEEEEEELKSLGKQRKLEVSPPVAPTDLFNSTILRALASRFFPTLDANSAFNFIYLTSSAIKKWYKDKKFKFFEDVALYRGISIVLNKHFPGYLERGNFDFNSYEKEFDSTLKELLPHALGKSEVEIMENKDQMFKNYSDVIKAYIWRNYSSKQRLIPDKSAEGFLTSITHHFGWTSQLRNAPKETMYPQKDSKIGAYNKPSEYALPQERASKENAELETKHQIPFPATKTHWDMLTNQYTEEGKLKKSDRVIVTLGKTLAPVGNDERIGQNLSLSSDFTLTKVDQDLMLYANIGLSEDQLEKLQKFMITYGIKIAYVDPKELNKAGENRVQFNKSLQAILKHSEVQAMSMSPPWMIKEVGNEFLPCLQCLIAYSALGIIAAGGGKTHGVKLRSIIDETIKENSVYLSEYIGETAFKSFIKPILIEPIKTGELKEDELMIPQLDIPQLGEFLDYLERLDHEVLFRSDDAKKNLKSNKKVYLGNKRESYIDNSPKIIRELEGTKHTFNAIFLILPEGTKLADTALGKDFEAYYDTLHKSIFNDDFESNVKQLSSLINSSKVAINAIKNRLYNNLPQNNKSAAHFAMSKQLAKYVFTQCSDLKSLPEFLEKNKNIGFEEIGVDLSVFS